MKKFVALFVMFIACSLLAAQTSFSKDVFVQETYLFQKEKVVGEPWEIILPGEQDTTPYGKFEYVNYPVLNDDGDECFLFDFKGYNIPVNEDNEFANGPYALIYYVDPPNDEWPADVYVLGVTNEVLEWESPANGHGNGKGKGPKDVPPGLEGVNLKISGSCDIEQIPVSDSNTYVDHTDVNYPNGGKIWLVPSKYLNFDEVDEKSCTWAEMDDFPDDDNLGEILFETSLITYGFVAEQEEEQD